MIDFVVSTSRRALAAAEPTACPLLPDHPTLLWSHVPRLVLYDGSSSVDINKAGSDGDDDDDGDDNDDEEDYADQFTVHNIFPFDPEDCAEKSGTFGVTSIGDYSIEELLSEHAYGSVFRASHVDDEDTFQAENIIIIKTFEKTLVFSQRVVAALLRSFTFYVRVQGLANVCSVLEVLNDTERVSVVLELASKGTIHERLAQEGPMPMHEISLVFRQLVNGVEQFHSAHHFAHGQISPYVVYMDEEDNVKFSGFGCSHDLSRPDEMWCDTVSGMYARVRFNQWVAPECWCGKYDAKRIDVWSMGLLLVYMCRGGFGKGAEKFDALQSSMPACSGSVRVFLGKSLQIYSEALEELIADTVSRHCIPPP